MQSVRVVASQPHLIQVEGDPYDHFRLNAARMEDRFFAHQTEEILKPIVVHYREENGKFWESIMTIDGPENVAKEAYGYLWRDLINQPESVAVVQIMEGWAITGDKATKGVRPSQHPKRQEVFLLNFWCKGRTIARIVPFTRQGPAGLPVHTGPAEVIDSADGGAITGRMLGDAPENDRGN